MKKWENAAVEEISLEETAHGAQPSLVTDDVWVDEQDGTARCAWES